MQILVSTTVLSISLKSHALPSAGVYGILGELGWCVALFFTNQELSVWLFFHQSIMTAGIFRF
jgi:hypothetical protein